MLDDRQIQELRRVIQMIDDERDEIAGNKKDPYPTETIMTINHLGSQTPTPILKSLHSNE